ncbi:MAG TPA: DUF4097 family beta strand repeat-containing protein [Thermoanaerobaculia bacterium]
MSIRAMKRTAESTGALAALMLGLWLAPARPAAAAEATRALHQTFPAGGDAEVRLANLVGRVDLVQGKEGQVTVDATIHAEGENRAETDRLLQGVQFVKGHDRKGQEEWEIAYPVDTYHSFHYPRHGDNGYSGFWSFLSSGWSTSTTYRGERVRITSRRSSSSPTFYVDLKIGVPSGSQLSVRNLVGLIYGESLEARLNLETGSGDIDLASSSGKLTIATGSGDVAVGEGRGEIQVHTGSGDIQFHKLIGNGSFEAGSGDVKIEKVAAGRLSVKTGSGDVVLRDGEASHLETGTGSGDVRVSGVEVEELDAHTGSGDLVLQTPLAKTKRMAIKTGSGDVAIGAGATASFALAADQGSGDLTVHYADAVLQRSRHDKVVGAKRGDGRTEIHIVTGSGDCVIGPHR